MTDATFIADATFLSVAAPEITIQPMTVGIGAICEHRKAVVIAADRLVTQDAILLEHSSGPKIFCVTNTAAVSITGSHGESSAILNGLTEVDRKCRKASDIAAAIQRERERVRRQKMDRICQRYFGVDFPAFTRMNLRASQNAILPTVYQQIAEGMGTAFILAAIDDGQVARLFLISDATGSPDDCGEIGFLAIGSGRGRRMPR